MAVVVKSQAQSVLDFASHLDSQLLLSKGTASIDYPDVLPYVNILPLAPSDFSKNQRLSLRDVAVTIWNNCNVSSTPYAAPRNVNRAQTRVFSYLLLASIVPVGSKKESDRTKLFQNALTVARECIEFNVLDLAGKVLELEASTPKLLGRDAHKSTDAHEGTSSLIQYHCLRLLLDWKRKRPDLADHQYSQTVDVQGLVEESDVEQIVDLLYRIGDECLSNHEMENAVRWLQRALHMLDRDEFSSNFDGSDLRLNVLHALIRALLHLPASSGVARALDLLDRVKLEYGPKLPVLLLALEIAVKAPILDADVVSTQLEEMIHTVHLIDANHKLLMHYIHCLTSASPMHAGRCLEQYISRRLIPQGNFEWTEKAIVSYLAICSNQGSISSQTIVQELHLALDGYAEILKSGVSSIAAQASHVVVWKAIRETEMNACRSLAMLWCQIGLHPIFEAAGDASLGKLERQLISYHLLVSNDGLANQLLDQMSFMVRNNKYSRYLAYCAAVRSGKDQEAQSCLNTVTNGTGDNDQLLFACVGESIKHGKPLDTARMLQRVVDKHSHIPDSDIDLTTLLKYTTKTLLDSITGLRDPKHEPLARLCAVFRHVVRWQEMSSNKASCGQSVSHIDTLWFERKSFDIAKTHVQIWPKRYIVDLFRYCTQLCYPDSSAPLELALSDERKARLRDATYLQTVLYSIEARNISPDYTVEDLPQSAFESRDKPKTSDCRLVLHQQVFKIFTKFCEQYQSQSLCGSSELQDMLGQVQTLIPSAFEALLFMSVSAYLTGDNMFDEVSIRHFMTTVHELEAPAATYALLADTVLAFASGDESDLPQLNGVHVPSTIAARLLGQIIQALRNMQEYNIEQAARWIRCVAQLILDDTEQVISQAVVKEKSKYEKNLTMLDSVVLQVVGLVRTDLQETVHRIGNGVQVGASKKAQYPTAELQWLATKLFNMAIDLLSIEQQDLAKKWAFKAIEVSDLVDVEGSGLSQMLRQKSKELDWIMPI